MSFTEWLIACREQVDSEMAPLFADAWPRPFAEPMRYPLFGGGKRVRPALVLAAHGAVGSEETLPVALAAASAVELVHTYSLVHDDLPAMDDDDERRGRPTVHKQWDEATAILSGDALLTEAFGVLARSGAPAETTVAMVLRLSDAAGYRGMVGGQAADVGVGGRVDDLEGVMALHRGKTGALLCASAVLGGLSAGASSAELEALEAYGWAAGVAFQLADDVLDADEDAGEDGPPSMVKLLGIEGAQARAAELAHEAIAAAERTSRPERLVQLARFIIEREV